MDALTKSLCIMKKVFAYLFILGVSFTQAQVGINTTTPNAQLDIRSSSQTTPSNTDGILIPKIDAFPATNPGLDQNGMLVFLTTLVGSNAPGFYYWEAASNAWIKLSTGSGGGTLDDAYNFGGPGQGREIVADFGPVTISGNDGIISTGSLGTGFSGIVGNGERLVWNPSRAAFRAGTITMNQWEQFNLGLHSFSFGRNNYAFGNFTGAWGDGNQVIGDFSTLWGESNSSNSGSSHGTVFGRFNTFESGVNSVIWGQVNLVNATNSTIFGTSNLINGNEQVAWGSSNTILSGQFNTVWGEDNQVNGSQVSVWGENNQAQANFSTVWGRQNISNCVGCTIWGSLNNANTFLLPTYEDNTLFGRNNTITYGNSSTAWGIGNQAESIASTVFGISNFARSMGETVLGIGSTDYFPVGGAFNEGFGADRGTDRLLVVGNAIDLNNNNQVELNERRDALVILKNGNTGIGESFPEEKLHVVGKIRMVDGFEGAGKILVGDSNGTLNWQDSNSWGLSGNTGTNSSTNFMGTIDNNDVVFRRNNLTSGIINPNNTLIGAHNAISSFFPGTNNSFFGTTNFMLNNIINDNTVIGHNTVTGSFQGNGNTVVGSSAMSIVTQTNNSMALGFNASVADGTVNAIAMGANSFAEVSNSMVLGGVAGINGALTNVNVGIGTISPQTPLHVVGNIRMDDGNQAIGKVLVSDANGTASWQTLNATSFDGWSTTGNTGLNADSNFIGTTDNVDVIFRRNNTRAGRLGADKTSFGLNALNPSSTGFAGTAFGFQALRDNTTGDDNTALGYNALLSNTTGRWNTAAGRASLQENLDGSENTAYGYQSLRNSVSGNNNTAVGRQSLSASTGNGNTAIGRRSLFGNITGSNNTGIGHLADVSVNNLINATAIGANASVGASNSLVLGSIIGVNGATSNVNVGVGTTTPQERLHIVGNIRMDDGNQAIGKVLVSDANGTASWQTLNATSFDGWSTTGNTGLNADSNFIGTTDNVDVIFRRNNTRAGRLGADKTSFGLNALNPSSTGFAGTAFGFQALRDNTTGDDNTALGYNALLSNTTGRWNTAAGRASLQENLDGSENTAYGYQSLRNSVSGNNNTAVGRQSLSASTGNGNTAIGRRSLFGNITGSNNTGIGHLADVSVNNLINATAIGANASVGASNSLVLGSIIGVNGATSNVNVGVGTTTPQERLHIVGNIRMVDGNQATGRVLTSNANGTATWANPQTIASGTLDQAYDFGGPGAGNTIIADAGAVTIAGTDGLVSTGNEFTGVEMPSGPGTRMVWNPRKGAFRVGTVTDSRWDDSNVGLNSVAMGFSNTASGQGSTAFGGGSSVASGAYSTSFGAGTIASGASSLASCFVTVASGDYSAAFNRSTTASGVSSASFGDFSTASGAGSLSAGLFSSASGHYSASIGSHNTASSYGETVIGIGATTYTPSSEGATAFRSANATDRLFVIGNAIDANNNAEVDDSERSDAMVVLKNGNIGLGTSTPQTRLEVVSPNIITTGTTRGNLHVMSNNPQDIDVGGAISLGGYNNNAANAMRVFGTIEGRKTNATSTSSSGYLAFKTNNANTLEERMRITNSGNVGIGTQNPQVRTHISGSESRVTLRLENTAGTGVGIDFLRVSDASTDWRIYNLGAFLTIGNSGDDLATVNDLYQFQGTRFNPMNDATQNLGQGTNRWNTLFASNGTINTSDAREKKNIQNLLYGLNTLMQLRPVSFEWKKDDGSGTKLGLIAQELQGVIPEVVRDWDWEEDELGNLRKVTSPILGVYYSDLIPVLIKATQEQQQLIQQQEQQLFQQQTLLGQLLEQQQQLLQRLEKLEQQK
jgi:trimeric autotransporter adhesin